MTYIYREIIESRILAHNELHVVKVKDQAEANNRLRLFVNEISDDYQDIVYLGIKPLEYGDCLIRAHREPTPDDLQRWATGMGFESGEQLTVQAPGTHPGGNAWWITPNVDIWVPDYKYAEAVV